MAEFYNENPVFNEALHLFMHTNRIHRTVCERVTQGELNGIHRSQHKILMFLSRNDNLKSQKQIAEHFDISTAAVAVSLKKLEELGYIEKFTGSDNRFNEVRITPKGKSIVERTDAMFSKVDKKMFENITPDDFTVFIKCLNTMKNNLLDFESEEL